MPCATFVDRRPARPSSINALRDPRATTAPSPPRPRGGSCSISLLPRSHLINPPLAPVLNQPLHNVTPCTTPSILPRCRNGERHNQSAFRSINTLRAPRRSTPCAPLVNQHSAHPLSIRSTACTPLGARRPARPSSINVLRAAPSMNTLHTPRRFDRRPARLLSIDAMRAPKRPSSIDVLRPPSINALNDPRRFD